MSNNTNHKTIQKLNNELKQLSIESSNVFYLAEKAIGLCSLALLEIKEIVKENDFQDEIEEINFFKHVKPQVYSKLLYFHELFKIETNRPKSRLLQTKYLKRMLKKTNKYFKKNQELCIYYWNQKEHHDELYFLRRNRHLIIHPETIFSYIDNEFSTLHDYTFSAIIAHEELIKYIESEIAILEHNKTSGRGNSSTNNFLKTRVKWTGSKVALIELIYALHSTNTINNGNISLKELFKLSEQLFNIELDDHSRIFLDIRMRKTRRTKFLDTLIHSLLKRMEDADG